MKKLLTSIAFFSVFYIVGIIYILITRKNEAEVIAYCREEATHSFPYQYVREEISSLPCDTMHFGIRLKQEQGLDFYYYFGCEEKLRASCGKRMNRDLFSKEVSGVLFVRYKYLRYTLRFANEYRNSYYMKEYDNLADTIEYEKAGVKQIYLGGNWMLYSDCREKD